MGMPAESLITTVQQLLALPEDDLKHELLDGEHVVTPTPRMDHQRVVRALYDALRKAFDTHDNLELFPVGGDIELSSRTLVVPDLFVIPKNPDAPIRSWREVGIPLLAVEVLSPSTASRDRGKKRRLYLDAGVEEYWIVDLDARLVERWRPGDDRPEIIDGILEWSISVGAQGEIDLPRIFENALGASR